VTEATRPPIFAEPLLVVETLGFLLLFFVLQGTILNLAFAAMLAKRRSGFVQFVKICTIISFLT